MSALPLLKFHYTCYMVITHFIGYCNPAAVENSLSDKLDSVRQQLQLKLVRSLKEYRNLYVVQHRIGGRLIFPESLRFLPLYILAISKSLALRGGYADVSLDERCAAGFSMMILPVKRLLNFVYPSLYRVDEVLTMVCCSHKADLDAFSQCGGCRFAMSKSLKSNLT